MRSIAELGKRAFVDKSAGAVLANFSTTNSFSLSVPPIMFSQAITASGVDAVRASMAFAITGPMNLRTLGPTAQVTMSAVAISWITAGSSYLELMAR